ncbi:MAG: T9SS type A sorting domain-containing protein [Saprospiraceae bacterium]|nr:T9SS type A sorting domain-containing protein [Saprospiraceae bacterium]
MKYYYLFFAILFLHTSLLAQTPVCMPDSTFRDSIGVFPLPFDSIESPMGGIREIACIGKPYDFNFTIVIGDTLFINGIPFVLDTLILSTTTAITGLPAGLSYSCNPPNCRFNKDEIGCVNISGTPATTNLPGQYALNITGTLVSGFFRLDRTFPDPLVAPGIYAIEVASPNSEDCTTSSTSKTKAADVNLSIAPNPVQGVGLLKLEVPTSGLYQYRIFNMLGREVVAIPVRLQAGYNELNVDLSFLPNGMYLHSINNKEFQLSKRLMIQN